MKKLLFLFTLAILMTSCRNDEKSVHDNQDSLSDSTMDIKLEEVSASADTSIQVTDSVSVPSDTRVSESQVAEKKESSKHKGSEYGDLVDQYVKNVKNSTYNFKYGDWDKAEKLESKAVKQANKIMKVKSKLTNDELKKFNKAYKQMHMNFDLWQ